MVPCALVGTAARALGRTDHDLTSVRRAVRGRAASSSVCSRSSSPILPGNADDRQTAGVADATIRRHRRRRHRRGRRRRARDRRCGDRRRQRPGGGAGGGTGPGGRRRAAVPVAAADGPGGGVARRPTAGDRSARVRCRADGRQTGIARTCRRASSGAGHNGGATSRGVTKDKITIVRWLGQLDPAHGGDPRAGEAADDPENVKQAVRGAARVREPALPDLRARGRLPDARRRRAGRERRGDEGRRRQDRRTRSSRSRVIDGTPDAPIPPVLARELAQRGVVCICTTSLSSRVLHRATAAHLRLAARPRTSTPRRPPSTSASGWGARRRSARVTT